MSELPIPLYSNSWRTANPPYYPVPIGKVWELPICYYCQQRFLPMESTLSSRMYQPLICPQNSISSRDGKLTITKSIMQLPPPEAFIPPTHLPRNPNSMFGWPNLMEPYYLPPQKQQWYAAHQTPSHPLPPGRQETTEVHSKPGLLSSLVSDRGSTTDSLANRINPPSQLGLNKDFEFNNLSGIISYLTKILRNEVVTDKDVDLNPKEAEFVILFIVRKFNLQEYQM